MALTLVCGLYRRVLEVHRAPGKSLPALFNFNLREDPSASAIALGPMTSLAGGATGLMQFHLWAGMWVLIIGRELARGIPHACHGTDKLHLKTSGDDRHRRLTPPTRELHHFPITN